MKKRELRFLRCGSREITDEEAENFKSVADLLQYLERRVTNAKRSSGG